jgi:hypothetical protein
MNFRIGLLLFLALVVFDGAIRKWLLPESEQLVYIAKDLLLAGLVAWYFGTRGPRMPAGLAGSPLVSWLGLYATIVALQVLNPSLPSVLLGVFGLKAHVLYTALVMLVPAAFRDVDDLARTLRQMLLPVILVLAFGVVQFYLPIDHALNRYVRGGEGQGIATFGLVGNVRVTSTFSYISGMTVFSFFAICLGLAFVAAGRWRFRSNLLAYVCLIAGIVVAPMTGARWIFYMLMMGVPLFLFGMFRSGMLNARFAARILLVSIVTTTAISLWSMQALESLEYRRQSTADTGTRIESLFLDPLTYLPDAGLLGFGAGATHQAGLTLFPEGGYYGWLPVANFEGEQGRIMIELGALGFVVAFGMRLYLCLLAWRALINGGTPTERAFAGASLVFLAAHVVSPIVFNVTAGALYWLCVGIVATILRDQHLRGMARPELLPGAMLASPVRPSR